MSAKFIRSDAAQWESIDRRIRREMVSILRDAAMVIEFRHEDADEFDTLMLRAKSLRLRRHAAYCAYIDRDTYFGY